jgi:hypothetical protein
MRDYADRPVEGSDLETILETSEMLEGIEAIVLSIADRVDKLSALLTSVMEGEVVRDGVRQVWNGERWEQT